MTTQLHDEYLTRDQHKEDDDAESCLRLVLIRLLIAREDRLDGAEHQPRHDEDLLEVALVSEAAVGQVAHLHHEEHLIDEGERKRLLGRVHLR